MGLFDNMQGGNPFEGILGKMQGGEGQARLYGLGSILSQIGSGQTPDAGPALQMLEARKQQNELKTQMENGGFMDMFSAEEQAYLATLPPQIQQEFIGQRIFAQPTPVEPIEINGQLVDPQTYQVVGDYRTPEAPPAPDAPTTKTIFDPETGREQVVQWNGSDWVPLGGVETEGGPLVNITNDLGDEALTPFQEAADKAFAEDYLAWTQGGGADSARQIAQLATVAGQLEAGENLTGFFEGNAPDWALALAAPNAIGAREKVEEVVQRNLRVVLGAQFTEREGERLISRAYNAQLSEAENAQRLRMLITQMQIASDQKQSMVDYVEANGTLRGYSGPRPTIADFDAALDTIGGADQPPPSGGSDARIISEDDLRYLGLD